MSIFLGNLFESFVEGATSNELSVLEGVAKQAKKDYDNAKKAYDNAKNVFDKSAKTFGDANKKSLKHVQIPQKNRLIKIKKHVHQIVQKLHLQKQQWIRQMVLCKMQKVF